jgi:SurA N-terminal domain
LRESLAASLPSLYLYHSPQRETIWFQPMLQQLRVASKSWVASVIIGVLVLAFAMWGVADIFRAGLDNVVAEVGSTDITDLEYDSQLRAQLRNLSAQSQTPLTMEQARAIVRSSTRWSAGRPWMRSSTGSA